MRILADAAPIDSELAAAIAAELTSAGVKAAAGVPVSRYTSFRLGGPAAVFAEPSEIEHLPVIGKICAAHGVAPLPLGRGTNILVSDAGVNAVVIRLGRSFETIDGDPPSVRAGGAAALPQVANWAARRALSGLEFSVAIPATVGGAVRMNAGAHASSVSDVLSEATVVRLGPGTIESLGPQDLAMTYRHTNLENTDVVCSATFLLRPSEAAGVLEKMEAFRAHRARTQPPEARNAGSMFKNPDGDSAGRLIEAAGLKGYRSGEAEVSAKHANFFIAHPSGNSQQVYDLMAHVQKTVHERSGVMLEPEVRLVGSFDETSELIA